MGVRPAGVIEGRDIGEQTELELLNSLEIVADQLHFLVCIHEYQADCDGEWGEIQVDFVNGTAEIVRLADWDTMVSKVFAKRVIRYLMQTPPEKIVKTELIPFKEN